MPLQPRRIAVLGAPGTGAAELASQLRTALAAHPEFSVSDAEPPSVVHDFALLMGLDQPDIAAAARPMRAQLDGELRGQLQALGLPYRVVYGAGPARLVNALLALGLPAPDANTHLTREQAQFDLNRGRTPWSCEKCSDPDCEHKLFTGLLGERSTRQR
jgi:HTH-type transcriptional regulator, transcriptional repressor of NAD biosynthesis genes